MPRTPIELAGSVIDLSPRFQANTTVVASPAAASETIIASLTLTGDIQVGSVWLYGWAAYTVGTNGTAVQFQIRRTNVGGVSIAATGALTGSQHGAAILSADDINGLDTTPPAIPGSVYVLTMQVTNGSATSTVSQLFFGAMII